jgi:regulator of protease activity HflC (stomatin/prohibitin superfamily)
MDPEHKGLINGHNAHPVEKSETSAYEGCMECCGGCCGFFQTWMCCCFCNSPYQRVQEGSVGVIQNFGKYSKLYAPGLYFVNPCTETMTFVDKRERVMDTRRQLCMTKDNINVIVDAVVFYKVDNSYKSLFSVYDLRFSLTELCRTSLRDVFGEVTLQQALEDRETLAEKLMILMDEATLTWGVDVTRCLIQEILFTEELQKSLSTAATAKRLAESKIIGAQADVQAARLMRNASDILNTPAAMQVRYLEAITSVAKANNPKVVFFPSDYKQVGSNLSTK